jgi:hypothetical protein
MTHKRVTARESFVGQLSDPWQICRQDEIPDGKFYHLIQGVPKVWDHRRTVIWQNTERYKEGTVVANLVFSISCVGIFYLGRAVTALLFTSSVVKCYGDVATLTWQFASRCGFPVSIHFVFPVVLLNPPVPLPLLWKHIPLFALITTWQIT